jgi:uncharacterized protein (TIGR00725 family)
VATDPRSAGARRRPVAAVVGGVRASAEVLSVAEELGRALVEAGFRLATGGLGGVMEAASRGARGASSYREGDTIGVLPGSSADSANPFTDIVIPTGMQFARNALLTGMADVVVAVGGGAGTLSEIALAWQQGRPVIAIEVATGWAEELAGRRLDARREAPIRGASTVEEAVELALELADQTVAAREVFE